jgi:hypothetical protein
MAFATSVLNLASSAAALSSAGPDGGPIQILQDGVQRILGTSPDLVTLIGQSPVPVASAPVATSAPVAQQVAVAQQARDSSDQGLRRLRIVR